MDSEDDKRTWVHSDQTGKDVIEQQHKKVQNDHYPDDDSHKSIHLL